MRQYEIRRKALTRGCGRMVGGWLKQSTEKGEELGCTRTAAFFERVSMLENLIPRPPARRSRGEAHRLPGRDLFRPTSRRRGLLHFRRALERRLPARRLPYYSPSTSRRNALVAAAPLPRPRGASPRHRAGDRADLRETVHRGLIRLPPAHGEPTPRCGRPPSSRRFPLCGTEVRRAEGNKSIDHQVLIGLLQR